GAEGRGCWMALWSLPRLRERVETYARVGLPRRITRTRWRFGSKRRFVATIEWLRLWPKPGFFPQTAQTLDIGRPVYRRVASVRERREADQWRGAGGGA